jgi:hypothetical protein
MRTKRSASALIVQVVATGTLVAALTAVAPDVYYDMHHPTQTRTNAVVVSATTPSVTPDVYYDM